MSAIPIGPTCDECAAIDGHRKWCGEARWFIPLEPNIARILNQEVLVRTYEPLVRIIALIEDATYEPARRLGEASVPAMMDLLSLPETTVRRNVRWLLDAGFIEQVPAERGQAKFAYRAVMKSV